MNYTSVRAGVWIGMYRLSNTTMFSWVDRTPVSYTNWYRYPNSNATEPNEPITNDVGARLAGFDMKWKDWKMAGEFSFVCESSPTNDIDTIELQLFGN